MEYVGEKDRFRCLNSAKWDKIDSLDGSGSIDRREKSDNTIRSNLAEVVRRCCGNKELDFTDFEISAFLQDTRPHLEERHEQALEQELEVRLALVVLEIIHHSFSHDKE